MTVAVYRAPELLAAQHELSGFTCHSVEQTAWLREHARQSDRAGGTRVFVVTLADERTVVAYYAWCVALVTLAAAPARLRKGAGRYPQPVALLARLGVDTAHEGAGLGAALLVDVLKRLVEVSEQIGCRALLVHCETPEAFAFYRHLIPEFETSPTDALHLMLLAKDIRRSVGDLT